MAEENKMAAASEKPSVPVMPKTVQPVFSSIAPSSPAAVVVKKSKIGTSVMEASFGVLIVVAGFFFMQNSESFTLLGANAAQKNVLAAQEVGGIDAEIKVEKYLNAVYRLEQFVKVAGEYIYDLKQSQSEYVSENKKAEYKSASVKLKRELNILTAGLKEQFATPLDETQKTEALKKINEEIESLKKKSGQVDDQALLGDIQDLESARKILINDDFKMTVNAIDDENPTEESLQKVLTAYAKINRSVTSLIGGIRQSRISWSTYLAEIEAVTKKIDPLFGTEFEGNLTLETLSFDKEGLTIAITGKTNTADTKNFTLVANLVDAYEASPLFKNAQERNFSKNESSDDEGINYDSTFQVEMTLEIDPTIQ